MKQEEKELLLKDLCARLPYGVFVKEKNRSVPIKCDLECHPNLDDLGNIKPYLRSMSSMTEEEKEEYEILIDCSDYTYFKTSDKVIDWLNKGQFDYRGLIPMGLALEAPSNMYNIK